MTTAPTIHASAALVGARGVLIRGAAGAGKSSLLLSLIYGAGNAILIADDRVTLAVEDGRLIASVPEALAGLLEVRGVGVVRQRYASPAVIDLVADLAPLEQCPRFPDEAGRRTVISGVAVPRIFIAVGAADGAPRIRAALADLYV